MNFEDWRGFEWSEVFLKGLRINMRNYYEIKRFFNGKLKKITFKGNLYILSDF